MAKLYTGTSNLIKWLKNCNSLSFSYTMAFCSGSEDISYQLTFGESETTVNILKSSFQLADSRGEKRRKPRGLDPTKKAEIIQKLLPLMPENRHSFWKNIADD
ncbi:hypothetical protein PoB_005112700 [Plakobranchus ocellatus]|uniref:Uncharacterized protein n=1 Tax=Plakobranchus ocellatus TaxID=259542 RepID=A0AAV4BZS7_9GAST|nr:hypothetical protein PoB_005112700 [Plakobranchus ocellatus]